MKYAWAKATAQAFVRSDGVVQVASERVPLRMRFNDDAGLVIEMDRDIEMPLTLTGIDPEVRFYLKSEEPAVTMGIGGHAFNGGWAVVRR